MSRVKFGVSLVVCAVGLLAATLLARADATKTTLKWNLSYAEAMRQGEREEKMVLVLFHEPGSNVGDEFEAKLTANPQLAGQLDRFVLAKVQTDAQIKVGGKPITVSQHPAFTALQGRQGFAIVDLANHDRRYGRVVKAYPFATGPSSRVHPEHLGAILDVLPAPLTTARRSPLPWNASYADAMRQAEREQKMVLMQFYQPGRNAVRELFEATLSSDPRVAGRLDQFVLAKVPLDSKIIVGGKEVVVFKHPAFAEMRGRQGFVIIDLMNKDTEHYGRVVSVFPFVPGKYYRFRPEQLSVILDLPPGTLTQRTMIYAVRVHPERPASTVGEENPVLMDEATKHSRYQAQILVQGHHRWDSRFHRIAGRLAGRQRSYRVSPVEIVAESWPNQDLVDSCVDCVGSWRQSPGHWGAVQARHASYGYDIRRGANGIWYATGIFSN